jgi:nitric oxide reductase NorD protein
VKGVTATGGSGRNVGAQTVDRLSLLASAIAGRSLEVVAGGSGEATWTDGRSVFVDPEAPRGEQLQQVVVQACLVCSDSLDIAILAKLRKPVAARRYLSLEGHRALAALCDLLPGSIGPVIDGAVSKRTDSATSSLALALGPEEVPDPPSAFGRIRPRLVVAAPDSSTDGPGTDPTPASGKQEVLRELEDEAGESPVVDFLSSPVGGGGPIGRLLKRLLGEARSSGTGAPGADAPTRFSRRSSRVSRLGAPVGGEIPAADGETLADAREVQYPEWDVYHRRYRPRWCTVIESVPEPDERQRPEPADVRALRRALARLGTDFERHRRQLQGEDLDLDALIDSLVAARAGSAPGEAVYVESRRSRRDLAVLVLLDISGSVGEPSGSGGTVHDHQLSAATSLTTALHEVGDRVALYGFRSQGRTAVHVFPVKCFDEAFSPLTEGRLGALTPGGFTRLGAAIRHGAATLDGAAGTGRRLLVVLSDGFAYDHGYEGTYGEADARRALSEARHRGIGCLCLSIAATTDPDALRRVFGTAAHAALGTEMQMSNAIAPLFRVALGTAEYQRRRSQRTTRSNERQSMERSRV